MHGSLGLSDEMPFIHMIVNAFHVGLADGPTEVHKLTLARGLLSQTAAAPRLYPASHIPALREQALAKYAAVLSRHGAGGSGDESRLIRPEPGTGAKIS